MGTRGYIGVIHKNQNIELVYNHFDSYLEGLGKTLFENYKNFEDIMNFINETINERQIYKRYKNVYDLIERDLKKDDCWIQYVYLYDKKNKEWLWIDNNKEKKEILKLKKSLQLLESVQNSVSQVN